MLADRAEPAAEPKLPALQVGHVATSSQWVGSLSSSFGVRRDTPSVKNDPEEARASVTHLKRVQQYDLHHRVRREQVCSVLFMGSCYAHKQLYCFGFLGANVQRTSAAFSYQEPFHYLNRCHGSLHNRTRSANVFSDRRPHVGTDVKHIHCKTGVENVMRDFRHSMLIPTICISQILLPLLPFPLSRLCPGCGLCLLEKPPAVTSALHLRERASGCSDFLEALRTAALRAGDYFSILWRLICIVGRWRSWSISAVVHLCIWRETCLCPPPEEGCPFWLVLSPWQEIKRDSSEMLPALFWKMQKAV